MKVLGSIACLWPTGAGSHGNRGRTQPWCGDDRVGNSCWRFPCARPHMSPWEGAVVPSPCSQCPPWWRRQLSLPVMPILLSHAHLATLHVHPVGSPLSFLLQQEKPEDCLAHGADQGHIGCRRGARPWTKGAQGRLTPVTQGSWALAAWQVPLRHRSRRCHRGPW